MTHGPLAEALVASSSMLFGEMKDVVALSLHEGEDPDAYLARLEAAMSRLAPGPLVLFDVLGGTPFNTLMRYARDHEVYAISGANVPMLLEAGHARVKLDGVALLESVEKAGHEGMVNLMEMLKEARG
jgi:mannose/fructose-specific phosphotransferase system component IIA